MSRSSLVGRFPYNGDGVRTTKTVDSATTQYVLDLAATLPVVISDTEAVYLYGLDILAQQQSERLYYAHDGLGSVRQLLDSTGDLETNHAYDPFGVPVVGGDVYNPFQYTGEAWDAEVELLYLRARYYQPEVGRFITKDPWAGDTSRPRTLNGFTYVANNPVNLVDPEGFDGYDPWTRACMLEDSCEGLEGLGAKLLGQYGISVGEWQPYHRRASGGVPMGEYTLWSDWNWSQLELLLEAAGDMSDLMEGGKGGFKARIAPVRVFKRVGRLVVFGKDRGGWAGPFSVTLSGFWWGDKEWTKSTIVHELAHWWDRNKSLQLSGEMLANGMWELVECELPCAEGGLKLRIRDWQRAPDEELKPPENLLEDWARSVAAYVYPDYATIKGWQISRSRWEYVGRHMNPGNPQPYPWKDFLFGPRVPYAQPDRTGPPPER